MHELTGKINEVYVDFETGKAVLNLLINEKQEVIKCCSTFKDADKISITVDEYKEKRSNAANNYMWLLCSKIAEERSKDKVKVTKEDVYREEISNLNVYQDDEIDPDKVKWRCAAWEKLGTGWLTERVDFTQDGNKEIIRFYYGSSQYNTRQMSRLINNIVQDCEALGIPTKTPDEIANMLSLWKAGE